MKKLFTNSMIIFALLLLVVSTESKADGTEKAKINELSDQIVIEIKEVLSSPYLRYESKDLSGEVTVYTAVSENGKIEFTGLKGINENLIMNISSKLNSLNLWTNPDYNKKVFQFNINYQDK
ncbi:MAG TPA: hypothetical protein PK294_09740 [Ignavibacteria bacterium]|nr:hypothetical protein [Ignavibacteria bacterium]HQY51581.1 hypothetical protein [Ignavibacteria bacterium]HRB00704.1 hypothetical protein [Ignavibacteria bacterium]